MTKEQIQALIDAKIAGQGSAVDVGGALPAILSAILDLATAPPEPETHVLEILSSTTQGSNESESAALARLKLDGETPTKEQLGKINPLNTIVKCGPDTFLISVVYDDTEVDILCGYYSASSEKEETIEIAIYGNYSHVYWNEL